MAKPFPLVAGLLAIGVIGVALVLVSRQSSSAQTVTLPGVATSDFASANITAIAADANEEHPKISADQAAAVATGGNATVSVLAANLIKLTVAGRIVAPQLAWAVSLDPATAPILPMLGDCGLNNDCTPGANTPKFAVDFVDADTGSFMFGWSRSGAGSSISLSR